MINNSQTSALHFLEKLTSLALQKLGQKILATRNNLQMVEEKIDVLVDFQNDYLLRAESNCRSGINNEQYHNYQYFLNSLEQSIVKQADTVKQHKNDIDTLLNQLNALQQKKLLYEKILIRQRTRRIIEFNKKEQKLNDSYSRVSQLIDHSEQTN